MLVYGGDRCLDSQVPFPTVPPPDLAVLPRRVDHWVAGYWGSGYSEDPEAPPPAAEITY